MVLLCLEELETLGCRMLALEYGIIAWFKNGKLSGTRPISIISFRAGLMLFKLMSQNESSIHIAQIEYIISIECYTLPRDRQVQKGDLYTNEETLKFCQLLGKLNWAANQSCPDILFDVCQLSSVMCSPTIEHVLKANKFFVE